MKYEINDKRSEWKRYTWLTQRMKLLCMLHNGTTARPRNRDVHWSFMFSSFVRMRSNVPLLYRLLHVFQERSSCMWSTSDTFRKEKNVDIISRLLTRRSLKVLHTTARGLRELVSEIRSTMLFSSTWFRDQILLDAITLLWICPVVDTSPQQITELTLYT